MIRHESSGGLNIDVRSLQERTHSLKEAREAGGGGGVEEEKGKTNGVN